MNEPSEVAAPTDPVDLRGKRAIVTGASSGIGRAIALQLADHGAAVAAAGRDPERTAEICAEIERRGGRAVSCTGDVGDEADAATIVETAVAHLGGIDVLVNCAGIGSTYVRLLHEWEADDFDQILRTNLRGCFLMSKLAIPHMLVAGGGAIVHISSVSAITVWSGEAPYGVSKAALNALSDHIAVEYGPLGIRSNALLPGMIDTPMHRHFLEELPNGAEVEEQLRQRHPIGRFGNVEEVATTAVFLCSDAAPFMTGAHLTIDGGYRHGPRRFSDQP
jgi:NAD(P)-dependent dehydrogenase (short-subunit alcohol dehydrogenase family)